MIKISHFLQDLGLNPSSASSCVTLSKGVTEPLSEAVSSLTWGY